MKKLSNLVVSVTVLALISSGLFLIVDAYFSKESYQAESAAVQSEKQQIVVSAQKIYFPEKVIIPKVGIEVEVKQAMVSGNDWDLFDDAVSYLATSSRLGEEGNAVFYAHNKHDLFGPIRRLEEGDRVVIQSGEERFRYVVSETSVVSSDQIDIVYPTRDERVTLFTCTNFNDADRFVVVATPIASFADILI